MNYSNNDDDWGYSFTPNEFATDPQPVYTDILETDKNSIITKIFMWMFAGLSISAITSFISYSCLANLILNPGIYLVLTIAELAIVFALSAGFRKMSATTAKICFIGYSLLNGVTLSTIFFYYEIGSIYTTFFIAASMFAIAAIYGKITKNDLSSLGTYLIMGLCGLIIAGIVNIFIRNNMLEFLTSLVGVIIFLGLTAYDVYRLRDIVYENRQVDDSSIDKIVIYGALQLYLDFVNLFLKLLRFFGKRRK